VLNVLKSDTYLDKLLCIDQISFVIKFQPIVNDFAKLLSI